MNEIRAQCRHLSVTAGMMCDRCRVSPQLTSRVVSTQVRVAANEAYQVGLIRQKKNGSCSPLLVGLLLEFLFHPLGSYIRHLVACEWLFVLLFQGLSSRPCARVHRIGLHLAR